MSRRPLALNRWLGLALAAGLALITLPVHAEPLGRTPERDREREAGPERITLEEMYRRAEGRLQSQSFGIVEPGPGIDAGPLTWSFLGPNPILGDYWANYASVSGRVSSIAVDPRDGNVVYIAAAQGGVWKTIDGGGTWIPLTDQLSSLASGSVVLDPHNPNVVYYGTGELHYSGDSFYGDGLFRSMDAGATWSKIATAGVVGSYISRVVVSPADSNIVFVGGSAGLRRSNDRGATWIASFNAPPWPCDDIAISTTDPLRVFAARNGSGVWRSINGGVTFTKLGGGLPTGTVGRVQVAMAKTNNSVLYASIATTSGALQGLYKSINGGNNWTKQNAAPNYLGGQGWYDHFVVVSPTDANICIAGGVYPYGGGTQGVVKTVDGGVTWSDITAGVDGSTLHPDMHFATFGPDGMLWVANDGGVWKSLDLGAHWINLNSTLGIAQFYTVGLHPVDTNSILGGTQDNGTVRFSGGLAWPEVIAGDGGPVAYDWVDPNYYFTTYIRLTNLYRWNGPAFNADVSGPWQGAGDRADWCNSPLIADLFVPNRLLAGTYRVFESLNRGDTWSQISGDLTITPNGVLRSLAASLAPPGGTIYSGASDGAVQVTLNGGATWNLRNAGLPALPVTDIVVDQIASDHAYVSLDASNGSRVWMTNDAGLSWIDVTGDLPPGLRGLSLAVDWRPINERLYLGTDYGVYSSRDGGAHWESSGAFLPNTAVYDLAFDWVNSWLVAATHGRSMWRAFIDAQPPLVALNAPDGGESWPLGATRYVTWSASDASGVDSVTILLSTDSGVTYPDVIASGVPNSGSYSWTVSGPMVATCRVRVIAHDHASNMAVDESNADFTITGPLAVGEADAGSVSLSPMQPNPTRTPATFAFTLPRASDVTLRVFDLQGRLVREVERGSRAEGRHAVSWDGRDAAGQRVMSGVYLYRLNAGAVTLTRRMVVVR